MHMGQAMRKTDWTHHGSRTKNGGVWWLSVVEQQFVDFLNRVRERGCVHFLLQPSTETDTAIVCTSTTNLRTLLCYRW